MMDLNQNSIVTSFVGPGLELILSRWSPTDELELELILINYINEPYKQAMPIT